MELLSIEEKGGILDIVCSRSDMSRGKSETAQTPLGIIEDLPQIRTDVP